MYFGCMPDKLPELVEAALKGFDLMKSGEKRREILKNHLLDHISSIDLSDIFTT